VGTKVLYDILTRIVNGEGTEEDLELLEEVGRSVAAASLCALGKSAPHPVTSTMKYFHDEYIAHIVDKTCPAGVCNFEALAVEETV